MNSIDSAGTARTDVDSGAVHKETAIAPKSEDLFREQAEALYREEHRQFNEQYLDCQRQINNEIPELRELQKDYKKQGGRSLLKEPLSWGLFGMEAIIFLGEVAVNYSVFLSIFKENIVLTFLAAAVLTLILVISASYVGKFHRWGLKTWSISLILFLIGVFFLLAYFRMTVFGGAGDSSGSGIDISDLDASSKPAIPSFSGMYLFSPLFFLFISINVLFLIVTAIIFYQRHDPDEEYEKIHPKYHRVHDVISDLNHKREELLRTWEQKRRYVQDQFETKVVAYRNELGRLLGRVPVYVEQGIAIPILDMDDIPSSYAEDVRKIQEHLRSLDNIGGD